MCNYLREVIVSDKSSGMPEIDCIYLINLDQRPDRLKRIHDQFDPYNLSINRVSAVNGWELPEKALLELGGPYGIHMGRGHFGCMLSHLSILKHALEKGYETIWVLEDDATILKDLSVIPEIVDSLNRLDPAWDVFFTDRDYRSPKGGYIRALATNARPDQPIHPLSYYTGRTKISRDLERIHNRYATTSMLISKRGIKKLFEYFTHVYIWQPIDIDMHYISELREYVPIRNDIVSNSLRIDSNVSQPPNP